MSDQEHDAASTPQRDGAPGTGREAKQDDTTGQGAAPANTAVPPRRRSGWSRLWHACARVAAWTLVLLALVVVGGGWLASRESTVRWIADQIAQSSGGRITLDGVQGSLLEGVSIDRVQFESEAVSVTVEHLSVGWFWLPPRLIQVTALDAERVHIVSHKSSQEPPKPPTTLALPINLRVQRLTVGELVIESGGSTTRIAKIDAAVRANANRIAVELAHAEGFGLVLAGNGRIEANAPFGTKLDLNATLPGVPLIAGLTAQAEGPLDALKVNAQGKFAEREAGPVIAQAVIHPFEPDVLGTIEASAERVPLTTFGVTMPQAVLSAKARLGVQHGVFGGPVELRNTTPGNLKDSRVPLESATARMAIDAKGVRFEQLAAVVSDGGALDGQIVVAGHKTSIDLNAKNVSLKAVHAAAVPVRVSGPVKLAIEGGALQAETKLTGGDLEFSTTLAMAHGQLNFAPVVLRAGAGRIEGQAKLDTAGARKFTVEASATAFDPSRIVTAVDPKSSAAAWLDARINGRVKLDGTLAPEAAVRIDVALENSTIGGIAVDGSARGMFATRNGHAALDDVEAQLHMSENELVARGGFGANGAVLSSVIRLPRLDRFSRIAGLPLSGSAEINSTVLGTGADPVIVVSLSANEVHAGSGKAAVSVAKLGGNVQVESGQVKSDFTATAIDTGTTRFPQATLQARGSVAAHEVIAQARGTAYGRPVEATLAATGGWSTQDGEAAWRGHITRIDNEGRLATHLAQPATLSIGAAHQRIEGLTLAIAEGRVSIESLDHADGRLATRGQFEHLGVQALSRWFPAFETAKSTLTLKGVWDLTLGERIDGSLQVAREDGDLWVSNFASGALGVEQLMIDAKVQNDDVQAKVDFSARRAGKLQASAHTVVSKREGRWGVAGNAPLEWKLAGELNSLAWLSLIVETPLNAEGHIVVDAERTGTVAQPVLRGTVVGDRLALRTFDPRAQLTNGRVRIAFDNKRIALDEFVFAGRSGQLAASGIVNLEEVGPVGLVDVAFDHLDTLTDPLYHVVVSGAVRANIANGQSTITGRFRADEAKLTLRDTTAPTLGSDVVLASGDDPNGPDPTRKPFPVNVALAFELGDRFDVSGYGADATLTGVVEIDAKAGQPLRAKGGIESTRGTYLAYGQELNIAKGMLSFSGPIDNPGIHFRAERPDLPVTVGVEVTGSLRQPKATLYSDPSMSNTETLSWLALGHGLDSASRNDVQVLSLAAGALLTSGEGIPLQTRLARNFGIDEVTLRSDSSLASSSTTTNGTTQSQLETTVVAVGKRLSRRLYMTFERSLAGTSTVAKLRYEVGKRWYIQTLTGTENALDVFFAFTFD